MAPLAITKLIPGGQGLATRADGKKGFFWNAIPGETVTSYEVTKEKTSYFEAIATKIENPSPHRVTPKDTCYLSTSPWQMMDYDYELEQKIELLKEQFRQFGIELDIDGYQKNPGACAFETGGIRSAAARVAAPAARGDDATKREEMRACSPSSERGSGVFEDGPDGRVASFKTTRQDCASEPEYFYRNKMEYALYYAHEDEKIHLAFRHRGTHRKFPIESSSLERPEILQKAREIIQGLNARGEEARKYQTLLLRSDQQGNVSGGLLENGKSHPVFPNLHDTLLGYDYSYSPNGFFQINLPVYAEALKAIKSHLGDAENVLDLYSGVGTIGLSVARDHNLTLVELNGSAYRELENNCKTALAENPSAKITPVLSASESALDYIHPDQTVIVDPPRAGLDDKLVQKLLDVRPARIIYLSCNPATQARDAKKLLEKYQITSCTPFNFFPRTPHLENLLTFE